METQTDFLTEEITKSQIKRKTLLPWWIKVFMWIFLIMGILVPFSIFFALAGGNFLIAIYGLETNQPLSLIGIFLIFILGLKGMVSFGFLKEKNWAVNLGIADAIIGIVVCVFFNYIYPFIDTEAGFKFSLIRVELLFLIPYLIKLTRIRTNWNSGY